MGYDLAEFRSLPGFSTIIFSRESLENKAKMLKALKEKSQGTSQSA